jgi:hypothetical protein
MKLINTLLFLITATSVFSQTSKIKVKKSISQDQMSSVVTIGGYYYGKCPISKLVANKHLKISNNTSGLKIISFETTFFVDNGILKSVNCNSDSLSQEIITSITSLNTPKNRGFYIENIKAINNQKDTLFLNPIILKLTN